MSPEPLLQTGTTNCDGWSSSRGHLSQQVAEGGCTSQQSTVCPCLGCGHCCGPGATSATWSQRSPFRAHVSGFEAHEGVKSTALQTQLAARASF